MHQGIRKTLWYRGRNMISDGTVREGQKKVIQSPGGVPVTLFQIKTAEQNGVPGTHWAQS